MPAIHVSRQLVGAGLLAAALASGSATPTAPLAPDAVEEIAPAPAPATPEFIPVVRYGRYTLVELTPAAAHLQFGPMSLRDALLTLAGPAWKLRADDRARQVCFERPGRDAGAEPVPEPFPTEAVQTVPQMPSISGGQP